MSYINIFISKPAKINVKNKQIVIQGESETKFPLNEVNTMLIESRDSVITSYALSELLENKVAVFVCDSKHIPNGICMPYNGYFNKLSTIEAQLNISKPLKKQLWKSIIEKKIYNQAKILKYAEQEGFEKLKALSKNVLSNDRNNLEATSASYYFKQLFGKSFTRNDDCFINATLNYGYTILRGLVARSLVVVGFEPCIGLFHHNKLNAFNLADDIIEPFRPLVDLLAFRYKDYDYAHLTPELKKDIYSLVNCDVEINREKHTLTNAISKTVSSLLKSIKEDSDKLMLPDILPLRMHRYE